MIAATLSEQVGQCLTQPSLSGNGVVALLPEQADDASGRIVFNELGS